MAWLTVQFGSDGSLQRHALTEAEITLGRGLENSVCIPAHWLHRRHAVLRREPDGRYRLIDLNSGNGVWMNGQRLPAEGCVLRQGEVFYLADVRCQYCDQNHVAPTEST